MRSLTLLGCVSAACLMTSACVEKQDLSGIYQASSGINGGICGDTQTGMPASTNPVSVVNNGSNYTVTLPNGCAVNFSQLGATNMIAAGGSCDGTTMGAPTTSNILFGKFALNTTNSDEASLRVISEVELNNEPCTFAYDVTLTKASSRLSASTAATFGIGDFVESVEMDDNGTLWALSTGSSGSGVFEITTGGIPQLVVSYPTAHAGNLVFTSNGDLYSTISGPEDATVINGIVSVDTTNGSYSLVAEMPEGSTPNGITADTDSNLYIADSHGGKVYKLAAGTNTVTLWADGQELGLTQPGVPGPNGVKVHDGYLYVSNTAQVSLLRYPINPDGSAGAAETVATSVILDDFALDQEGNVWATTHPINSLIMIRADGSTRLINDYSDGMVGPTSVVFGTTPATANKIYTANDGNIFGSAWPPFMQQISGLVPATITVTDVATLGAPVPGSAQ